MRLITTTALVVTLAAATLTTTGCASTGTEPTGISHARVPPGVPAEHLHFTKATMDVGDEAVDFTLPRPKPEDGTVTLSDLRDKPVVLIFGSFT